MAKEPGAWYHRSPWSDSLRILIFPEIPLRTHWTFESNSHGWVLYWWCVGWRSLWTYKACAFLSGQPEGLHFSLHPLPSFITSSPPSRVLHLHSLALSAWLGVVHDLNGGNSFLPEHWATIALGGFRWCHEGEILGCSFFGSSVLRLCFDIRPGGICFSAYPLAWS